MVDDAMLDDVPGRPRILVTPGHTRGHCAISLADRDVVFSGDALVTRDPYTGATGPRLVSLAATVDADDALRSLDRLGALAAGIVLPGHGFPWAEGVGPAVERARTAGFS